MNDQQLDALSPGIIGRDPTGELARRLTVALEASVGRVAPLHFIHDRCRGEVADAGVVDGEMLVTTPRVEFSKTRVVELPGAAAPADSPPLVVVEVNDGTARLEFALDATATKSGAGVERIDGRAYLVVEPPGVDTPPEIPVQCQRCRRQGVLRRHNIEAALRALPPGGTRTITVALSALI